MTDTFHKNSIILNEEKREMVKNIKLLCDKIEEILLPIDNREGAISRTHLETFCMWATKSICNSKK